MCCGDYSSPMQQIMSLRWSETHTLSPSSRCRYRLKTDSAAKPRVHLSVPYTHPAAALCGVSRPQASVIRYNFFSQFSDLCCNNFLSCGFAPTAADASLSRDSESVKDEG